MNKGSQHDGMLPRESAAGYSLRRIRRLIARCEISTNLIAKLILKLISVHVLYNLTLGRTNWKLSDTNLTPGIIFEGMSFSILFRLPPKRGNSNYKERIDIMQRFIRLFGMGSIKCLVADREFVGYEWLKWLNDNAILYHIRIRDNFWVEDPRKPFLLTRISSNSSGLSL